VLQAALERFVRADRIVGMEARVGIKPSSPLQTRKLFIPCFDKTSAETPK
jgi:hypothetical protein